MCTCDGVRTLHVFALFHAVGKQRFRKRKERPSLGKILRKKKNIINIVRGCSNEKEQSCALSFVVVSLPRHSSLNRLLDQPYTASLVFSPRAHHARVSRCRNRSSRRVSLAISCSLRSVEQAWIEHDFSFEKIFRYEITSYIVLAIEERSKRVSKRENDLLTGDPFVKISTNPFQIVIHIVLVCNARNIRTGGDNGQRVMNQTNILKVAENIVVENINWV